MFILALLFCFNIVLADNQLSYVCPDNIYCYGSILRTVQMSRIFNDSKTFVDMKLKHDRERIFDNFDNLMLETESHPDINRTKAFVESNFDPPGSEFEEWTPSDWIENPKFLNKISNEESREWCKYLNQLWKMLGRKMKDSVKSHQDRHSIIYVDHPVIIPGGRFREFYYWDSYWIVKGLLLSEMYTTVRGMLLNFISMVNRFGFVPNGGRIYYTMRSQPPLLIPMVKSYLDATNDTEFLSQNIDSLENEVQFWLKNRTVTIDKGSKSYVLARYSEASIGPRPESYREDVTTAQFLPTNEQKNAFYSRIKSAAESGWDFSSRWFIFKGGDSSNLIDISTDSIVPVDLNSILYMNIEILSYFYQELGDSRKSLIYARMASKWRTAVNRILWHEDVGVWLDYDIQYKVRRNYFYASNLYPLWTKCYDESRYDLFDKILNYLNKYEIDKYLGGVPTSLRQSGQQWDFPNAWPPLQWMIIEGLESTDDSCSQIWARNLARKWIKSNFLAYNQTGAMYEKYDATISGGYGGGGEYEVQLGFGWTNGIVMDLINKYPDSLHTNQEPYCTYSTESGGVIKSSFDSMALLFSFMLFKLLCTCSYSNL